MGKQRMKVLGITVCLVGVAALVAGVANAGWFSSWSCCDSVSVVGCYHVTVKSKSGCSEQCWVFRCDNTCEVYGESGRECGTWSETSRCKYSVWCANFKCYSCKGVATECNITGVGKNTKSCEWYTICGSRCDEYDGKDSNPG